MELNNKPKTEEEAFPSETQTVQTVHEEVSEEPPISRQPYIELAQDENGDWSWCLWSVNGRPIAVSVMPFKRRHDCQKNLTTALELFRKPNIQIVATI
jgi:uncharacterized protein YegP (UPF0339 family)